MSSDRNKGSIFGAPGPPKINQKLPCFGKPEPEGNITDGRYEPEVLTESTDDKSTDGKIQATGGYTSREQARGWRPETIQEGGGRGGYTSGGEARGWRPETIQEDGGRGGYTSRGEARGRRPETIQNKMTF